MQYYKFTDTDTQADKTIIENADTWIKEKLTGSRFSFGIDNITSSGVFRLMGWKYDFRPLLKNFTYKQYGSWHEIWALNKTNVRKLVYGRVDKIIEIK